VALLLAGFFVAEGVGTGPKATTTVAFSRLNDGSIAPEVPRLLGAEWLARWRHSGSKYPPGLDDAQKAEVARRIEGHPQFAQR
jgi:queuine tRNA-ribosyltransferase